MLTILQGDWIEQLRTLPDCSVQCCVTSPPYYGLRDYGVPGQLGLEKTPAEYVTKLVSGFQEVRRVLKDDATFWLNLGDSYASGKGTCHNPGGNTSSYNVHLKAQNVHPLDRGNKSTLSKQGLKPKDLIGIPWMAAFALRADGWWLRQDIIWHKPSCMPESVTDRCTKSHEYIFLFAKSQDYFYDHEAIKEPSVFPDDDRKGRSYDHHKSAPTDERNGVRPGNYLDEGRQNYPTRNKRSVWSVTNAGYREAHFATFPPDLIRPCILAGSKPGDTVMDPFAGSGTTGMVSLELGRSAILIELNPDYIALAKARCNVTPGFAL